MEAQAVPREAAGVGIGVLSPRMLGAATDARLVALVRTGNAAAFEALYNRYHRPMLSFCRHMLGDPEEAADAVQHSFMAAYNAIVSSEKTILLRAWLFTIARNRCYSVLRARREQPAAELVEPSTEGLAAQVQRREDLRALLGDLRRLPDDQRAALVLAELGTLSHGEIGATLDVPVTKVKALVFQARESLIASRTARDTDCSEIRRQLSTLRGGALRRGNLRRHLRECPGCREYRRSVELQRRGLAAILPVVPPLALRDAVLGGASGTSGTVGAVAGSGLFASAAFKGLALKGLLCGLFALAGTAATFAVVHASRADRPAALARTASVIAPAVAGARVSVSRPLTHHHRARPLLVRDHFARRPAVDAAAAAPVAPARPRSAVSAVTAERRAVHRLVHHRAPSAHHSAAPAQSSAPSPTAPATGSDAGGRPSDHGNGNSQGQGKGKGRGKGHHHKGNHNP